MQSRDDPRFYDYDADKWRLEAHNPKARTFSCLRCQEEVASGAMWCAHCGFDLTTQGTIEQSAHMKRPWLLSLWDVRRLFLMGAGAAAAFAVADLALEHANLTASEIAACAMFVLALFVWSCDFTLNSAARAAPVMLACLLLTSF